MGSPLVLHLADGRLAVIAGDAYSVAYYRADYEIVMAPVLPAPKAAPSPQTPRQNKTTPAAKPGKATRLKGEDRDKLKTRAFELHKDGLTPADVHRALVKEGADIKYATVWGWMQ